MRKLSELYQIVLDVYNQDNLYNFYLCTNIENCTDLTRKEASVLYKHFREQRPTQELHREFYLHPMYNIDLDRDVWFESEYKSESGIRVRREFLSYLIEYCIQEGI